MNSSTTLSHPWHVFPIHSDVAIVPERRNAITYFIQTRPIGHTRGVTSHQNNVNPNQMYLSKDWYYNLPGNTNIVLHIP